MSLVVWLPLNGNLDNQGILNYQINNTKNASIDDSGKIGKCFYIDGKCLTINNFELPTGHFSAMCWVKFTLFPSSSNAYMITLNTSTSSDELLMLGIYSSNGTSAVMRFNLGGDCGNLTTGLWYHMAVTYGDTKAKLYLNGELLKTINSPTIKEAHNFVIGGRSSNSANTSFTGVSAYGYYNDVRIYDECLSEKQIKEISKGLVLHYTFSDKSNDNIAKNTNVNSTSYFGMSEEIGGSDKTIVYDNGIPCVKIVKNSTVHSGWVYIYHNSIDFSKIKPDTNYTVSLDIKANVSGYMGFHGLVNENATNYMTSSITAVLSQYIANLWSHIIFNCKTISDFSSISVGGQVIYFNGSGLLDIGTEFMVKNIKLEEGLIATPWCPNSADPAYTALGYNNNLVYDNSGFKNHANIQGTLITTTSSPRYNVAIEHLDDCSLYIYRNQLDFLGDSGFTFACWINPTNYTRTSSGTSSTGWQFIISLGRDAKSDSSQTFGANIIINNGVPMWYIGQGSLSSNVTIPIGTWAHVVGTWDGVTKKIYIDGVLKNSAPESNVDWLNNFGNNFVIGKMSAYGYTITNAYFPFVGKISDARIYSTALSADDIKELYEVTLSIDKNGNIYCYEFIEE